MSKRFALIGAAGFMVALSSCSIGLQKSVRSSGVYCSESRLWLIGDATIATAAGVAAVTQSDEPLALIPAGVFLASAAIGVYKRRNCVRHRAEAPPEAWAKDRERIEERERERAARRAVARKEAAKQKRARARALISASVAAERDRDRAARRSARAERDDDRGDRRRRAAPRRKSKAVGANDDEKPNATRVVVKSETRKPAPQPGKYDGYTKMRESGQCFDIKGSGDSALTAANLRDRCIKCLAADSGKTFYVKQMGHGECE